jgi:hypothetical protein
VGTVREEEPRFFVADTRLGATGGELADTFGAARLVEDVLLVSLGDLEGQEVDVGGFVRLAMMFCVNFGVFTH